LLPIRRSALAHDILVFALWYWRLDGGGPLQRDRRGRHNGRRFLFPQMTEYSKTATEDNWSPRFIDYLFIASTRARVFTVGYAGTFAMGQGADDAAVGDFIDHCRLLASRAIGIL